MTKTIIILTAFSLIIFVQQVFAEDVTTGNATAEQNIHNSINGGQESITNRTVNIVNGVKTETNSSSSGSIQVKITNTPPTTRIITTKPADTTIKPRLVNHQKTFFDTFFSNIQRFFSSFFK